MLEKHLGFSPTNRLSSRVTVIIIQGFVHFLFDLLLWLFLTLLFFSFFVVFLLVIAFLFISLFPVTLLPYFFIVIGFFLLLLLISRTCFLLVIPFFFSLS